MLDIAHLLERKPGQLSGGQQQRVALGRALVKQPLVFLLDEPFSNLDAALRSRMRTEVKHLHLRLGTTSVFVTHDQEEAMTLSDLIAVMRDGKLVQFGTQDEIYRRPRDTYVATFVGKPRMSLVEGALEVGDGRARLRRRRPPRRPRHARRARARTARPGARGDGRARRGRAGHPDRSGGPPPGSFPATVQLLEPIGSDTFVELAGGSGARSSRASRRTCRSRSASRSARR